MNTDCPCPYHENHTRHSLLATTGAKTEGVYEVHYFTAPDNCVGGMVYITTDGLVNIGMVVKEHDAVIAWADDSYFSRWPAPEMVSFLSMEEALGALVAASERYLDWTFKGLTQPV